MGQDILYLAGYFFWEPVVWLPRALIAHALVYQHLLKTIAAGLLFFSFLRLYRIEFVSSLLGSLLLAFSAYMCMGACWFVLADEVVGFTTVLFATEWALHRGKWQWLTLTVAAIGLISAFHFYLCALLLSFYVPAQWMGYVAHARRSGCLGRWTQRGCCVAKSRHHVEQSPRFRHRERSTFLRKLSDLWI
jgi:hypothetical protein